jgi:hypothetical protein
VGPINPPGKRTGARYIITMNKYLTRWAEARTIKDCSATIAARFIFDDIITIITLIFTRHDYLASDHLRFLLCENTIEQLFLKTPFIKAHTPFSITACVYTLVDPRHPVCTYKSTKKGNMLTEHTTLGKLTKPFSHAWLVIRPNT